MAKDAILNIIFGANTKELDKALDGATKRLRDTAGKMNDLGKSLSIGLTAPIAAFGVIATKNAVDSAKAIAQVEAAVQSTGGAAGRSVAQLEEMAAGLQRISLYDDDQILKDVTANLLTFTNVTGTEFDKAQVAILNLSTRLGTDLTSASVQVGKALNDPIKGVTALGRAGVQFTAAQKEQIAALVESGDVAAAQSIILGELETQFGGAAEAAANADPYTQLANEVGNLSEDFGVIINEAIRPLVAYVRQAVDAIKGWSDETKTTVLVIGGLLAVLGPTLIAVSSLITAYTTIKGALIAARAAQIGLNLATLANPYVLAAAAIVTLGIAIYGMNQRATDAADQVNKLTNAVRELSAQEAIAEVNKAITEQTTKVRKLQESYDVLQNQRETGDQFDKRIANQRKQQARDELANAQKTLQGYGDLLDAKKKDLAAEQAAAKAAQDTAKAVTTANTKIKESAYDRFVRVNKAYMAEQQALEDLNKEMNNTALTLADLGEGPSVAEAILGKTPVGESPMNLMDFEMPDEELYEEPIAGAERYVQAHMRAKTAAEQFSAGAAQAIESAAESVAIGFAEMTASAMSGGEGFAGFGRFLLGTLADLAIQVGKIAIGVGISVEGIKKALQSLNPVLAVAAGIALIALGSIAKNALSNAAGGNNVPALATGGLTTGPMLAMIGDNASGKEAVIPFERMGEFLNMAGANQPSNVTVTGRISGRDIMLSNERSSRDRKRIR